MHSGDSCCTLPPVTLGRSAQGSNAASLGTSNRRLVVGALRAQPGLGRRAIAEQLGLTPAAVANIVVALGSAGVVEQDGHAPSNGGKPGERLRIRRGARYALGVHIDRDEIVTAAVDLAGNVLWSDRRAEPADDPDLFLGVVAERVQAGLADLALPDAALLGLGDAMARLTAAMTAHPGLVAGEGRACTDLMRAMKGRVAVKTGAEAVFVAIAPERGMGIALKIADGATRASEAAITALLVHCGLLEANHPVVGKYLTGPVRNWRGTAVAERRLSEGFLRL